MQPILKINLSARTIEEYIIPRQWEIDFLGGASLAARLLYDELLPSLVPYSPEASLLFLNGPLSGTSGPSVGRFVICAKSPATGLWGESNCGGFWGPELRMAGYDGLWISGKSETPVYISVVNKDVKIRPADHLWGMDTYSTQTAAKTEMQEIKNLRVAVIGPAGEAMIPFSLILTDHGRVAGRTGMGAVMGSKNLKAIAVKGTGKVPVADPDKYNILRSNANRELKADSFSTVMHELGTAGGIDYFDYLGDMPKKYFQEGFYKNTLNVSGATIAETILAGTSTCHACVIACGRVVQLDDGVKRKGPEYETIAGFGPNLLFDDPIQITRIGELCDRLGIDTISMSNIVGLVFKLKEMGIISEVDHPNQFNWGSYEDMEALIKLTLHREGLGKWTSMGARELARHFNREQEAVQVNGLEVPYHDPRGSSGMALVYATSPRGACHNQSDYFLVDMGQAIPEIGVESIGRHVGAEKALNVILHQNWRTIANSLVMCLFANMAPQVVVDLINAAVNLDWDIDEMMRAGDRGWNLKRVINHRLGLTGKDDKLPPALLQPYMDCPESTNGFVPDYDAMIEAYYQVRKWDRDTGVPKKEKLLSVGLEWLVEDIWS